MNNSSEENSTIPVIPMEDDLLHAVAHPFYYNPSGDENPLLIGQLIEDLVNGLLALQEACNKVSGRTI